MQEQPSKHSQHPLEHSGLFWRMEWLLLSLQDQHSLAASCCSGWALLPSQERSHCAASVPPSRAPLQSCPLQPSVTCVSLPPNLPRPSSPPGALWAQGRILTGSLRLGSPSSLPTPSCCSSASSQLAAVWRTQLLPPVPAAQTNSREQLQPFPSGLCICPVHCLPREAPWPPPLGQWQLWALRSLKATLFPQV